MRTGTNARYLCMPPRLSPSAAGEDHLPGRRLAADFTGFQHGGNFIEDEATPHFFHRHAFRLVRLGAMDVVHLVLVIKPRQRAAPELLRTHRGDVDIQEAVEDGSSLFPR